MMSEGIYQMSLRHCDDGFSLFFPAGKKHSKPIHITCMPDERDDDASLSFRNSIVMEAGSTAELMIDYCNLSENPCIYEDITEITLGEAATLEIVRLQKSCGAARTTTATTVQQAAGSRVTSHYITFCEGEIRNSMKVKLAGEKASHTAAGLSFTKQNAYVDNDILIKHSSPDCQSNQHFKHILSDVSTAAFTGRIVVDKDSQKTVAYQRSANIMLNPKAKMNIQPQLEIYADDVKCSHGATVGQLDAEALFYMRSRGIGENEARKMLIQAFAGEVIENISCNPFRERAKYYFETQE